MQELVLVQPGRTVGDELEHDTAQADTRREFEERLSECSPLAYRVTRGVFRNTADAEDVAREALLRAYRQFERLRDRNRFRAWLVRIAFRLALDRLRSGKRREQRDTVWAQPKHQPRTATAEDIAASTSSKSISTTPSRNCRRNCAWCFCLQLWKATRSRKSRACWAFPPAR